MRIVVQLEEPPAAVRLHAARALGHDFELRDYEERLGQMQGPYSNERKITVDPRFTPPH